MTSKRMVAVAIGVRDASPLTYLPGAVNGARAFAEWATALGYTTTLITDEADEVTVPRLASELQAALQGDPIRRLVLYFAGHGLIREAEEGLWLLSDWHRELRAVAVEALKRRLYMHPVDQITIFADSCRSLTSKFDWSDLTADAVLGTGPIRATKRPPIDKFIAAQDGSATFSVPGDDEGEDRCLFTGVLLEGLWGTQAAAFSKVVTGKITSSSLGTYLLNDVPKMAERYGKTLTPDVTPTFPEGENIYFGDDTPPTVPTLPKWPDPASVLSMGLELESDVGILGTSGSGMGSGMGSGQGEGLSSLGSSGVLRSGLGIGTREPPPSLASQLAAQPRPARFETGSGFAVSGAKIERLWVPEGVFAEPHGNESWWRIGHHDGYRLGAPVPVLIELEGGHFAAVAGLPQFIASVLCDKRGVSGLVYRHVLSSGDAGLTELAIAALEERTLRGNAAIDLAVQLRVEKHIDPVLGVVSAYLYDSNGDIDSIRRMAYFYVMHNQPIPYDVALLAQLQGMRSGDQLSVTIPAVPEGTPRTEAEKEFTWTYSATPEATGVVGGLWPWTRQGWTFLSDPSDDGSTLVLPGLIELTDNLTSARFATLNAEGGQRLAAIFDLEPRDRPVP